MGRRSAHEISFFLRKNDGRRELSILDRLAYAAATNGSVQISFGHAFFHLAWDAIRACEARKPCFHWQRNPNERSEEGVFLDADSLRRR